MFKRLPKRVRIVEMGARDGLQNEPRIVPTATKLELIARLRGCGLRDIEVGAFVSPKWVPQMSDSFEVLSALDTAQLNYPVLVPNLKGLERAVEAGVREIAVFGAASESFSKKNINASVDESLERFKPVLKAALDADITVRGYVSCVIGCPYDGEISPLKVLDVSSKLLDMGCYEISLGDTIGVGNPYSTAKMLEVVTAKISPTKLALHMHDTYGQALSNILIGLMHFDIEIFDSSVSGLGGCPYAKGATGNVATEDVVYMLHGMGIDTGIDLLELAKTGEFISNALGRTNGSNAGRATLAKS